jgi:hypothetical protein
MDRTVYRNWSPKIGPALFAIGLGAALLMTWGPKMLSGVKQNNPISLEYFTSTATFSEVEGARALLSAEVSRFITTLRDRYSRAVQITRVAPEDRQRTYETWVRSLQAKVQEFKGTAQEFELLGEMLLIAKMGGLKSDWINEYLRLIYEAPSQSLIAASIKDACEIATELHREEDLAKAFRHLLQVPMDLENKEPVELALRGLPRSEPVRLSSVRNSAVADDARSTNESVL